MALLHVWLCMLCSFRTMAADTTCKSQALLQVSLNDRQAGRQGALGTTTIMNFPKAKFDARLGLLQDHNCSADASTFCFVVAFPTPAANHSNDAVEEKPELVIMVDGRHAELSFFSKDVVAPGQYCCEGQPPREGDLLDSFCWMTHSLTPVDNSANITSLIQDKTQAQPGKTVIVKMDHEQRELGRTQVSRLVESTEALFVLDPVDLAAVQAQVDMGRSAGKLTKFGGALMTSGNPTMMAATGGI